MTDTVFFMHIPRCGGTTYIETMRRYFHNPAPQMSWYEAQRYDFTAHDFIYGHYPASLADKLGENVLRVTLVREPVGRVLSHFQSELYQKLALDEWLNTKHRNQTAENLQTHFFNDLKSDDYVSAKHALMSCDVVGVVDQPDGVAMAIQQTCRALGKRPLVVRGVYNQGQQYPLYRLEPSTLGDIQQLNLLDTGLYEYALETFYYPKLDT